ncbi:DUF4185 domain-containing protein [Aeromicrobium alkaliterrae]|uniref:DUF4185 domain-containing protein n=1 Tax=Aeromicrobium alkaliterrae TaxID=302168 RepID=A0ABN2K157_9ACTN
MISWRTSWRARVALGVAPAAVAVVAVVALVPQPQPEQADPPALASETQCVALPPIADVDALNAWVDSVRGGAEFQGADVGADALLQDGRRLWVFGDTLRSEEFDGQRFVRNSMMVLDGDCANVVLPADHGALIADRDDGVGYWPMSIAVVHRTGYDLVGVGAQRVEADGVPGDPSAFTNLGPAVAVFIAPVGQVPQLVSVTDIGEDSGDPTRPTWGAASAVSDGWVYLYGTAGPTEDLVFGFSLQVARVRPDEILDPTQWRYWDGSDWVADPAAAQVLIENEGGVSQTLSVFERDGRWYAVSKRDEFLGSDVIIWTAPAPTGPFTPGPVVAEIPSDLEAGALQYMPLAHPDFLPEPGTVVISYSRNDTDLAEVAASPFLYRPAFIRVPLP